MNAAEGRDRNPAVEMKGKTVEKALQKALNSLGARVSDVDIEIVDAGQKGFLGIFGAREAQIRVTRKKDTKGIEEVVDDIARTIMKALDVNYRIFAEADGDSTYVNIETAGVDGLLIGRKGDTLNSLQHLVGRIVSRRLGGYQRLTLDVGGYLKNRQEILKQKAVKAAERAKKTNREVQLEPMKASERRIVHVALAEVEGVSTYTTGNGEMRKVYVAPAKDADKQDRGDRRGRFGDRR
ncbi:MAG: protein jag [Candidatus Krumholzibacteria bacterium]|nr:protein jag [Candidatus Krumholzibacteria bacterium]